MRTHEDRSAAQWFDRAAHCYIEKHQGCAWCGCSYCVFRSPRHDRVEYECIVCEFFACYNHETERYYVGPGQASLAEAASPAAVR